jgi:flagellar hook-associated protein 3 FlgL
MFADGFVIETQKLQKKQIDAQKAIASGQRMQSFSDDPAAFRQTLEIQAAQRTRLQYQDNIRDVTSRIEINHNTAINFHEMVTRASELLVRINGSYTQTELNAVANELDGILRQAINLGNSQQDGQFLFGGTYLQPSDTDPVLGGAYQPYRTTNVGPLIASVTYRGNESLNTVAIDANSTIANNVVGTTATTGGLFSANGLDIFQLLIVDRDELLAGNRANIAGNIANLRSVEDNVANIIGTTATNLSRLKITAETLSDRQLTDENAVSRLMDTDMVKEATNLQRSLSAYEAALQTGARVLNTTLLDYL